MKIPQIGRLIAPDGTETILRPKNGKEFKLQELQAAVAGYIERVVLKPGNGHATMYINEEGKLEGLARNPKASAMALLFDGDYVAGNALLVSREKGGVA